MTPSRSRPARHRRLTLILGVVVLAAAIMPAGAAGSDEPADMVLAWNAHAVAALSNQGSASPPGAAQPPQVAALHLAMVQLAVYDAVNAIDGGRAPYLDGLPSAPASASKPAATATAAHDVLVGLTPALPQAVRDDLDSLYATSLASIPDGAAKSAGVSIGASAAAAMLADRANDGRYSTSFTFSTGTGVGEWRPVLPSMVNDPFAWSRSSGRSPSATRPTTARRARSTCGAGSTRRNSTR
jgi:hypothetical protein